MSEKKKETFNPYNALGVGNGRADEMSAELQTLRRETKDTRETLTVLAERYEPESLVMGLYMAIVIMDQEKRLLPKGITFNLVDPGQN